MGPTPPGTGVIAPACASAATYSTSPTLPSLYPASITTAPGLIHAPLISSGTPTAAITTSAEATWAARSTVREWQYVTVAPRRRRSIPIGNPSIGLRPTTTACFPESSTPVASRRRRMPLGVHDSNPPPVNAIAANAAEVTPSTSLSAEMASTQPVRRCGLAPGVAAVCRRSKGPPTTLSARRLVLRWLYSPGVRPSATSFRRRQTVWPSSVHTPSRPGPLPR